MNPILIAPPARLPRLRNITRRITVLAMLAGVFISIFRADAQPVVSSAFIHIDRYMGHGASSNLWPNFEYRTSTYDVDWIWYQGGHAHSSDLHALPTYTNAPPYVIYEPWKIDFTDSLTLWPPLDETGTNRTITGWLGINPQWPTAITNITLFSNPPGSWPPYYYVTNIFNLPLIQNVTNITTGVLQPVFPPDWPHYIDWVQSTAMSNGMPAGISTNTAIATVQLYTGHSHNTAVLGRSNKFTLLSASANGVTGYPVNFANISVAGQDLNADYKAFVKHPPAIFVDGSPSISNISNYYYRVSVESHKIVTLSRAYHFLFGFGNNVPPSINELRDNFDAGAALLSKDDDTKVPDDDPSLVYPMTYNSDDVPLYVEFIIHDGVPRPPSMMPVFPVQFASDAYFEITSKAKAIELLASAPANVLQVMSMNWPNHILGQVDAIGGSAMVVEDGVEGRVLIHEWGHLAGIQHRGVPIIQGFQLVWPNPGPITNAIMAEYDMGTNAVKINRFERNLYNSSLIPLR